jgi:hypothetical protein
MGMAREVEGGYWRSTVAAAVEEEVAVATG